MLLLLFSAAMKFSQSKQVVEGFEHLGWPTRFMIGLGVLETSCAIIYAIPITAVLGALLVTAYLGGAMATHMRIGEPIYMHIVLGILVWLGLFLRDRRVRALIPLRQER